MAAGHFARAAELYPETKGVGDFRIAEALSFVHAGDLAAAERVLDAWERSLPAGTPVPDRSTLHAVRAICLAVSGRVADAAAELARGAFPPGSPGAEEADANWAFISRTLNAALAFRSGKGTDAEAAALRVPWPGPDQAGMGYYPARDDYRVFLAESLAAAGRRGEAAELIDSILAKNPRCRPALEARSRLTGEASAALTLPAPAVARAAGTADAHPAPAR